MTSDKMTGKDHIGRRNFLSIVGGIGVASANPRIVWDILSGGPDGQQPPITTPNAPFSRAFNFAQLNDWITPTNNFFVRSHFGVPEIDASRWTISVVEDSTPRLLSMEALMKLPSVDRII